MQPAPTDEPLTREHLAALRKRFVRKLALTFGGLVWAGMVVAFATGAIGGRTPDVGSLVVIAAAMLPLFLAAGYLLAIIMWEREKAYIETREYERKKRGWPKGPDA